MSGTPENSSPNPSTHGVRGARPSNSMLGEPKVWLCAMGLALGILMTAGLLALIIGKGLVVFWPAEIVKITTADADGKPEVMIGEIRKRQERRDPSRGDAKIAEWLVFLGNKDAWGQAFKFVDEGKVKEIESPKDIIVAERLEYGDSIFYPVSLTLGDGKTVPATDATFFTQLDHLVKEGNRRREEIMEIEKDRIGAINRKLSSLDIDAKLIARDAGLDPAKLAEKTQAVEQKRQALQTEYQALADKAGILRKQQHVDILNYKISDGTDRQQPIADIVNYYQPNQLSFMGKLGWFFHNGWDFLSGEPREANTEGGIFPAIFGTFIMTILMSALVTPFGVVAAIYLREYAKQGFMVRAVRISVNNLAGVPSIVFGVFGLGFFVYYVGGTVDQLFFNSSLPTPTFGTGGILWASFTLALLTLPVVIVATEEALTAVPRGLREAAMACGASKWQAIQRVVLPSALPGILTGVILSMARGAGEVAPLMLVGVVKLAPTLPLDLIAPFVHAERKFMHLGFHIYDLGFQSPDSEAAKPMVFATTLLLIVLVVVLNIAAIIIRNRIRKKYAVSTF